MQYKITLSVVVLGYIGYSQNDINYTQLGHLVLVNCNSLYLAMLQRIMAEGFTIKDIVLSCTSLQCQ